MKAVIRYVIVVLLAAATLLMLFLPLLPSSTAGYLPLVPFCAIPLFFVSLLTLFLMWKHKKERYTLLCLLLLSLFYLHPYIPSVSSLFYSLEDRQQSGTLTVVSWNCDNFQLKEDTLNTSAAVIKSLHPDIICLQERPHTSLLSMEKIKKVFADYPYIVTNNREDEVLNVIIFSRYPLSNPLSHYFTGTFNKYLSVDVKLPQELSAKIPLIRLFNIHLQTTGLNDFKQEKSSDTWQRKLHLFRANTVLRNQQADEIAQDIAQSPYPTIVCGDFNAIRTSSAYRKVAHRLHDTYRGFSGSYFYHTSSLSTQLARICPFKLIPVKIDHILVASPLQPSYYEQPSFFSGDHRIQCAVIKIPK
jgi:endonuclease/exonuclease/phosphatase (EEP) superfamily protein YafD